MKYGKHHGGHAPHSAHGHMGHGGSGDKHHAGTKDSGHDDGRKIVEEDLTGGEGGSAFDVGKEYKEGPDGGQGGQPCNEKY